MASTDAECLTKKTIYDLPLPCLQSIFEWLGLRDRIRASEACTMLREAAATSKCLVDDQFTVSGDYFTQEILRRTIPTSGPRPPGKMYRRFFRRYRLSYPGVLASTKIVESEGPNIFIWMRSFFTKLHVKELELSTVPLERSFMDAFNEFIDVHCSFDRLLVTIHSEDEITNRLQSLIARARKDVVIMVDDCDVTPDLLESMNRPVTFKGWDWGRQIENDPEAFFVQLVRQGYSFEKITASIEGAKELHEIIDTVLSSDTRQKIDVSFGDSDNLLGFETLIKETRVCGEMPPDAKKWLAGHPNTKEIRTYKYRGATIHIASKRGVHGVARLIVSSEKWE